MHRIFGRHTRCNPCCIRCLYVQAKSPAGNPCSLRACTLKQNNMAAAPPPSHAFGSSSGLPTTGGQRVPVLLPMPFAGPFDYKAPASMALQPGDIVTVPLGNRRETGVVWDASSTLPPTSPARHRAKQSRITACGL
ncbi:primosomal protein N' (replication factor Y) (superfamily II helicase) [Acetobacter ghanensis]|uniref:Primosomal protein N' (Replication factor Y) (Superfamily II helicase) n=1 Tax=Acetobacter ghanensis TaxID=431306 RepID=A0A0U4YE43_9PROT|nr:primosomal protein N' (replication factor Y) (superfamily II helicase) [Acetobacter ghanensis]